MTTPGSTPRPSDRFSGDAGLVELDRVADELLAAAEADGHGRAQRTLYRSGAVTIALFAFRAGASLPSHAAAAVITIEVRRGRVSMTAGGNAFDLRTGHLLRLAPRTPHDVRAAEPSVILVHIAGTEG